MPCPVYDYTDLALCSDNPVDIRYQVNCSPISLIGKCKGLLPLLRSLNLIHKKSPLLATPTKDFNALLCKYILNFFMYYAIILLHQ